MDRSPTTNCYIIHDKKNNAYKIGMSKNPTKRLKQLQTGNSNKLYLLASFKSNQYLEKFLHKLLSFDNIRGEWFELTVEKLEFLIDYLEERYERSN